jgi:RimJ/RimL family protein N-acetyltransferase
MQSLGGVLAREESDAYVERAEKHLSETGFCPWAVEAPGVSPLIGAVGLKRITFEASFTAAVEVAWRLHRPYWGQGYRLRPLEQLLTTVFIVAVCRRSSP